MPIPAKATATSHGSALPAGPFAAGSGARSVLRATPPTGLGGGIGVGGGGGSASARATPARKEVPVREGETFFIPSGVPHSPTRPPGTVGVVVELRRPPGVTEHQQFYCAKCQELVFDKEFDCADIVENFAQSMEDFWADPALSTCQNCGTRVTKPTPIKRIIFEPEVIIERQ